MTTSDLYDSMKLVQSEYVSASTHNPSASYLPYRRYLVDWMSDVGEQFNLHQTTIHTAILYLDKIFREQDGAKPPPRQKWQMLATACITCASKYEEAEEVRTAGAKAGAKRQQKQHTAYPHNQAGAKRQQEQHTIPPTFKNRLQLVASLLAHTAYPHN